MAIDREGCFHKVIANVYRVEEHQGDSLSNFSFYIITLSNLFWKDTIIR